MLPHGGFAQFRVPVGAVEGNLYAEGGKMLRVGVSEAQLRDDKKIVSTVVSRTIDQVPLETTSFLR